MTIQDKSGTAVNRPLGAKELVWRVAWISIRLVLVFVLASGFQPFFYQAF